MLVVLAVGIAIAESDDESGLQEDGDVEVLARWDGGELTQERFREIYDPLGQAMSRGGDAYTRDLCKAVYQEIYAPIGERLDLDEAPEVKEILDRWERERLVSLFIEQFGPDVSSPPTDTRIQQYYNDHLEDYAIRPTVNIQVLYIACNANEIVDGVCVGRMARMLERFGAGEAFLDLAVEERERSGNANGEFTDVFLSSLAPELVEAIRGLPAGGVSEVVESPRGVFLLKIVEWGKTGFIPIDRVTNSIRAAIKQETLSRWRSVELVRLRAELNDFADGGGDDEVLAAAALKEGLNRTPAFVRDKERHRAWTLADAAFAQDSEILPDDEEIGFDLIAAREVGLADRRYDLVIELIPEVGAVDAAVVATKRAVALRNASDSFSELGEEAPGERSPDRIDLEGVRGGDLESWSREVVIVLEESEEGEWLGPFQVEKGPMEALKPGEGLESLRPRALIALVGVKRAWVPVSDEQRRAAHRGFRNRITTADVFLSLFSQRWGLVTYTPIPNGLNVDRPPE